MTKFLSLDIEIQVLGALDEGARHRKGLVGSNPTPSANEISLLSQNLVSLSTGVERRCSRRIARRHRPRPRQRFCKSSRATAAAIAATSAC
jgi:hypothetical protein